MWWPFQWLFIYVLGGFTCIPLLIGLGIWYVMTYGSVPIGDDDPLKWIKSHRIREHDKQMAAKTEEEVSPPKHGFSGYLTVRRHFRPNALNTSFLFGSNTDLSGAEVKEEESDKEGDAGSMKDGKVGSSAPVPTAPTVSQRLVGAYKQVRKTQVAPPKELFYCVLKGSVLFLYEDDKQTECVAAISIEKYHVGMEKPDWGPGIPPGASKTFDGKDGEMFGKRNACVLRLVEKEEDDKRGLPSLTKGMDADGKEHQEELENAPWFFFTTRNIDMEDLYISLIQVSAAQVSYSNVFSSAGMKQLVDTIDSEPDPLSTRWLNALFGRVFLSLNQTRQLEEFIINKIKLKLTKVQRPAWLGEIVINEVHVGKTPPIFHRPMLKDLTPAGGAAMEIGLKYRTDSTDADSGARFIASTHATIPLGYKEVKVNLMVEARMKTLEGNVLLRIKEPPTNRIWWGFTTPPKLEIDIKPVIQDRKLNLSVILNQLDSLLRRVIAESIVLPAMDDVAFFPTAGMEVRGGIFSSASKYQDVASGTEATAPIPTGEVMMSNEDPSSAVAETPGLRKRVPSKAQTLDHKPPVVKKDEPSMGISRVDTAPPDLNTAAPVPRKRTIAFEKWFAAPPPSSSATAANRAEPSTNPSTSRSSTPPVQAPRPLSTTEQQISAASILPQPRLIIPSASSSASRDRTPSPPRKTDTPISVQSSATGMPPTTSPSDTVSLASIPPDSTATTGSSPPVGTGATLFSAVKQFRAGDKKALQDMTKTGMDGVKKGWMNFAAKRRGAPVAPAEPPSPEHRPRMSVPYWPVEEERDAIAGIPIRSSHGSETSRRSMDQRTLKERLDAAAHSTSPPLTAAPIAMAGRQRSDTASSKNSSGSMPALLASPSKSSVPTLSASSVPSVETQWARSNLPAEANQSVPDIKQIEKERRQSSGSIHSAGPVSIQPGMGRGMVVPRVIKRPGEVTGLGSTGDGMVRRVSSGAKETLHASEGSSASSKGGRTPATAPKDSPRRGSSKSTDTLLLDEQAGHSMSTSAPARSVQTSSDPSEHDLASAMEADRETLAKADSATPPDRIARSSNALDQPLRDISSTSPGRGQISDDLASAIQTDVAIPPVEDSASSANNVKPTGPLEPAGSTDTLHHPPREIRSTSLGRGQTSGDLASAIQTDVAIPPVSSPALATEETDIAGIIGTTPPAFTVSTTASVQLHTERGDLASAIESDVAAPSIKSEGIATRVVAGDADDVGVGEDDHSPEDKVEPTIEADLVAAKSVAEDALRRLAERDDQARTVKAEPVVDT